MQDSIYERIHKTLTWKRVIGFNVVLFLVLIVPLSVQLAKTTTENRSSAAGVEAPPVIPPPNYPTQVPKIDRVNTFFGKSGDTVVLLGANFGDYQWASHVFVGSAEAATPSIVRWSNNVIEVRIPDSARTGKVSVSINGKQAQWEGNLLLYDPVTAAKIGLQKISGGTGEIVVTNASRAVKGLIELSYVSEPITIQAGPGITITSQSLSTDSLGKKILISFESTTPLSSTQTQLVTYTYPGIGAIEILRGELYDNSGRLLSVYADPLGLKLIP